MTRKGILTPQRKIIFEIVSNAKDHPTAAEIIERLRSQGHQLAYATVYNSLKYLTEEGLIRELKLEGDASRYDGHVEDHQHIMCRKCGKVDEVFNKPSEEWLQAIASETGYNIEEEHIVFKGVCPKCQSS
jgi:Fur family transcriptional regulator, peroxide stress response regulator